jgi:hypothetical protein
MGSVREIACELVENVSFEHIGFRAPYDVIANSHLSTVLRSFVYNLWAEQWANQKLHEDADIVSLHAKNKWIEG